MFNPTDPPFPARYLDESGFFIIVHLATQQAISDLIKIEARDWTAIRTGDGGVLFVRRSKR
jgi:hypothetical protein